MQGTCQRGVQTPAWGIPVCQAAAWMLVASPWGWDAVEVSAEQKKWEQFLVWGFRGLSTGQ